MTGHLDDAEIDQESPIYSFSFGLSCVFLIGGPTKEDKPTAVRLNSGDLLSKHHCNDSYGIVFEAVLPWSAKDNRKIIYG